MRRACSNVERSGFKRGAFQSGFWRRHGRSAHATPGLELATQPDHEARAEEPKKAERQDHIDDAAPDAPECPLVKRAGPVGPGRLQAVAGDRIGGLAGAVADANQLTLSALAKPFDGREVMAGGHDAHGFAQGKRGRSLRTGAGERNPRSHE